jgi:hypothetical protein
MPKNLNSASRLLEVIERAHPIADNTQTLEAWAGLLNVPEGSSFKRVIQVGELVHALNRELDLTTMALANAGFSPHLYGASFEKVKHALSPMLFPGTWNQAKQYFGPDVMTALAFSAEILPDEEAQIPAATLAEIQTKLVELRSMMDDPQLPPRLFQIISHHIYLIQQALAEYPVAGAKAFRKAGHEGLGEIIEARDEVAAAKDVPAVKTLESTWKTVNTAADTALKAEKMAQLGQRAWEFINGIF